MEKSIAEKFFSERAHDPAIPTLKEKEKALEEYNKLPFFDQKREVEKILNEANRQET